MTIGSPVPDGFPSLSRNQEPRSPPGALARMNR